MTDFSKHMPKQAEVNEKSRTGCRRIPAGPGTDLKQLGMEKHVPWLWPFSFFLRPPGEKQKTAGVN